MTIYSEKYWPISGEDLSSIAPECFCNKIVFKTNMASACLILTDELLKVSFKTQLESRWD